MREGGERENEGGRGEEKRGREGRGETKEEGDGQSCTSISILQDQCSDKQDHTHPFSAPMGVLSV